MPKRLIWLTVRIAAAIAVVVVPFGYAVTGVQTDVLMGAGCGLAVGVGVGLRGGSRSGVWTGVLIGSIVGVITVLMAGTLPLDGFGVLVPPILAVSVGLIDGLSRSSFSGYRDVGRETCIVAALLALGLFPTLQWGMLGALLAPFLFVPWTVLMAGLLSYRREGWRDARPPWLLFVGAVGLHALMAYMLASEIIRQNPGMPGIDLVWPIAQVLILWLLVAPAAAFLLGRAAIIWLQPRLRVYGHLAGYLRVMWVPIGGFAVGYLTIIVLFSGFYGMLGHFRPDAFAGAGVGIADWFSFAFFTALGQDFTTVAPVSVSARMLVGAHLILSAGWALVLFAAVMSSIGPKLDRIARRYAEEGD